MPYPSSRQAYEEFQAKIKNGKVSCKVKPTGDGCDKKVLKIVKDVLRNYAEKNNLSEVGLFFKISLKQIKDGYHDVSEWSFDKNVKFKTYVNNLEDFEMIINEL